MSSKTRSSSFTKAKTNSKKCLVQEEKKHTNNPITEADEARFGEIEYSKVLLKSLREAIDENDKLRDYVTKLNTENERIKEELDQRDKIIKELAEYYQFCQVNHKDIQPERENTIDKEIKSKQPRKKRKTNKEEHIPKENDEYDNNNEIK